MKRAKTIVTAIPNKAYIKIMDICIASERLHFVIIYSIVAAVAVVVSPFDLSIKKPNSVFGFI